MSGPITPDERAAMRHLASVTTGYWSDMVPRLLDALDTAEADLMGSRKRAKDEVRRVEKFLRMERVAARRNLERAEKAEAEVARLHAAHDLIASVAASGLDVRESVATLEALAARPAPVWDEDAAALAVFERSHEPPFEDSEEGMREAKRFVRSLAVVREPAPARPDRETRR